jgi:hypothetical protein
MKTLYFSTNFNSKLGCAAFIHIDKAPAQPVKESQLGGTYTIEVKDGSHAPVQVQLISISRLQRNEMYDCFSLASHGLDAFDFLQQYPDQQLAVYYYKKVI